ncbi:hypothetical protein MMC12_005084 [Toensbergia leucococca]|nr:hypothetical protein [Toensbergia leucococca]
MALPPGGEFHWAFLVWLVGCSILSLIFLFYFNRLFAFLFSSAIRAYTWHRYRIYLDAQALQFSLLGGRIFFKGLRYHGHNETILVHDGYITWRYWLRRVRKVECFQSAQTANELGSGHETSGNGKRRGTEGEAGGKKVPSDLPCRITIKARGLEWFIYNRSPAYDEILKSMSRDEVSATTTQDRGYDQSARLRNPKSFKKQQDFEFSKGETSPPTSRSEDELNEKADDVTDSKETGSISTEDPSSYLQNNQAKYLPNILNVLPIKADCTRGAIIMGNENTRSVLVAKFDSAVGHIDARNSRPLDSYKPSIGIDFVHPVIRFRHNEEFRESQLDAAAGTRSTDGDDKRIRKPMHLGIPYQRHLHNAWHSIRNLIPYFQRSVQSFTQEGSKGGRSCEDPNSYSGIQGQNRWLGLSRYLDDEDDLIEQERWRAVEYGQFPTIVDSPSISMNIYWDVPGLVPEPIEIRHRSTPDVEDDINGEDPPDWRIDVQIRGGTVWYGPWADRQRTDLQGVFFPNPYRDAVPAPMLLPGQSRVSTVFKLVIEIEELTTLVIPTREGSKDWRWKGQANAGSALDAKLRSKKEYGKRKKGKNATPNVNIRPYGWLDLKFFPDSTVSFSMDLVARNSGYRSQLDLDLLSPEMSSSVNHGLLWKSKSQVVSCDLSYPLSWNALRQWRFDIRDNGLELFLIRDHIFLLTDLINDWASGPPADFYTFVPFDYAINIQFINFRLYLNANDSNIINNPSDVEDNTFVIIKGEELVADLDIPMKKFRPIENIITFDAEARDGSFELRTPLWNTQHTFLSTSNVVSLKDLKVDGSYAYHSATSSDLTDTALLNIHGDSLQFNEHGFLIRYFMRIKDNYFGDDLHFRTLEEYQDQISKIGAGDADAIDHTQHSKLSNDLDVILSITTENACALMPINLYSAAEHIKFDVSSLCADLRFTNYYMDLAVCFSPMAISRAASNKNQSLPSKVDSTTQLFVDGLKVFGHRLFGLPPTEPTYVCNWDFNVGSITGESSIEFLHGLIATMRCFPFSFEDAENILPPLHPQILHDVTFLRVRIQPIVIWLRVEQAAFRLSTNEVKLDYNDWAGPLFSERLFIHVPDLSLAIVDSRRGLLNPSKTESSATTYAYVGTTIEIRMIQRKHDAQKNRYMQQNHINIHDARTHRATWLLKEKDLAVRGPSDRRTRFKPPAMPFPSMPEPLLQVQHLDADQDATSTSHSTRSSNSMATVSRKSSFFPRPVSRQSKASHVKNNDKGASSHQSVSDVKSKTGRTDFDKQRLGMTRGDKDRGTSYSSSTRKTSYQSLRTEHETTKGSLSRPGFAFSSPYKTPYFPLLVIIPDIHDVPNLPETDYIDLSTVEEAALDFVEPQLSNQDLAKTSFIVYLNPGLTGFCTPEALHLVNTLLLQLQTKDPVTLLDELQIAAMTDILKAGNHEPSDGKIIEVNFQVPFLNFRFVSTVTEELDTTKRQERYDLSLESLRLTARSSGKKSTTPENAARDQLSVHMTLDNLSWSARERIGDLPQDQAIIRGVIYDPVLWLFRDASLSGGIQFKDLEIVSASRKVKFLASLVNQTTVLSEEIVREFSTIMEDQKVRFRLLVVWLANEGGDIPDPPFLTRASFVLRGAPNHLRTNDSWKMISRLRFVYQRLSKPMQDRMAARFLQKSMTCPLNAMTSVVACFENWHTWDIAHIRESLLMQRVYGHLIDPIDKTSDAVVPIKLSINAGGVRLLIEPGPNQNEFVIERLLIDVAVKEPLISATGTPILISKGISSMVQIHCDKIAVRLNWELCELLEDILQLYKERVKEEPANAGRRSIIKVTKETQKLHIVMASETSILSFDSINLKAVSLGKGLKASIMILNDRSSSWRPAASILVNADAASTEIQNRSKVLSISQLRGPSIYLAISKQINAALERRSSKFVGCCREMSYDIREDPLGFIELMDFLLKDEVAFVKKLTQSLRLTSHETQPVMAFAKHEVVNEIHAALFLDSYLIRFTLLPSLTYEICGKIARSSIRPSTVDDSESVIDFDIKENSHALITNTRISSDKIASMQMPPINGRLRLDFHSEEKSVAVNVMVERVALDGSSVYALIAAVNRPEIANLIGSVSREFGLLKDHHPEIFGIQKSISTKSVQSHQTILYDACIVLAGLSIVASIPKTLPNSEATVLKFDLDCVQVKAANRGPDCGSAIDFPEIDIKLRGIKADLERYDDEEMRQCGNVAFRASLLSTSKSNDSGDLVRAYQAQSDILKVNLYAETAPMVVRVLGHLQDKLKTLDLSNEANGLRKLRHSKLGQKFNPPESLKIENNTQDDAISIALFSSIYSLEMTNIEISWKMGTFMLKSPGREAEDLVLSFKKINLTTQKENAARLLIEDFQLQMVPISKSPEDRSLNSALLPEVVFNVAYVSTIKDRRLAFQAAGKSLDLRLTSQFILPASDLRRSIALAVEESRTAAANWSASPAQNGDQKKKLLGNKKLASLLVDADFAGAVVYIQGRRVSDPQSLAVNVLGGGRLPQHGRYGQFTQDNAASSTTLRAPGIALKVEYKDTGIHEPSLNAEFKVDASSNVLYPTVVPLVLEISSSVKEIVGEPDSNEKQSEPRSSPPKFLDEETLRTADPRAIFGKCKLNLGLRICRQEFTLSCQPIARVAATARFDDIYLTLNTVKSNVIGQFFTLSATFTRLQASVQHVYSRESTGSFEVDSIVMSVINSKHVSAANGLSAILKISPMKAQINAKQSQDFLLFREIWVPSDIRHSSPRVPTPSSEPQAFVVQRYQQVAAAGAFPWNATVAVAKIYVELDLGQSLGRSSFTVSNLWVSSKKTSDWEQNLCLGFEKVLVDSTGRMSGFIELQNFRVRTAIQWPLREQAQNETPLIQASLGFDHLRVKAAFDYQAFLIADVTTLDFLMYNVRNTQIEDGDRLVGVVDGDKVQVFCTTASASQGLALYQAFQRLIQEKQAAYETSLRDIEQFLRRKSTIDPVAVRSAAREEARKYQEAIQTPLRLHTIVVVTLKAVNLGAFSGTFFDSQILKVEALGASARFAVTLENEKIHSSLGMTLGQLRVALASVTKALAPTTPKEVSVEAIVSSATTSRGGTILKVPKVVATMQTWQIPESRQIDYIFKSSFQGKVDVGWNYSRIGIIRGMLASHTRALASRLGKPLPQSALQITGGPRPEGEDGGQRNPEGEREKITAVVNVPQSKYNYTALEPAVIETPQLRDMGEATPPLEWIGLHRERLPNLVHQIVIVSLLEVAKEVEDAYSKILGSS